MTRAAETEAATGCSYQLPIKQTIQRTRPMGGIDLSYQIDVYVVSLERIYQVLGSRDEKFIKAVLTDQAWFLSNVDDWCEFHRERDPNRVIAMAREAVSQLINGDDISQRPSFVYGYAFQAICAQLGRTLTGFYSISGAFGWIEAIDAQLAQLDAPLRLNALVFDHPSVEIPNDDGHPFIGEWPARDIVAGLDALRTVDMTKIDGETAETFAEILVWLEETAKTPGASLIGFLR